ncbi:Alkaline phosphatase-like, alpha/beta/alpha [Metarhizium album ARSEF 1941]|uniref:Alkaline phosphatase n=1 Tax=Metarhizium album (strain ARSEF 1941) TaxID=1081103 RepID=A0A0B2X5V2_METAS|nr:Alkaline phosphatase-like, alpha/beta/alpha [Metarhizium album ARSEF 1941]KHO01148.1 Alkaline phosphatase-like, alpha/beta/alpha [Metarhizium album ARSEF 1941]
MAPQFGATFVPGGFDDYYLPEVVAPSPQRVTPQVPQNMQDDLQRLELEAKGSKRRESNEARERQPSPSTITQQQAFPTTDTSRAPNTIANEVNSDITAYKDTENRAQRLDTMGRDAPSFSPFPNVTGDNIPPADDAKEEILWSARKHVLHSQDVRMQISWAADVLLWADIAMDAASREPAGKLRPATPRIEHELRIDALNIVNYLAGQEHPQALYMRSKWLEFGKFGHRVDKREAYSGYKRAAELGNARSEYRMGMLFEQSNDMSKAKEHYYKGMSMKDSAALYRMGMMSLLGQHGETKDYAGGIERIRTAADSSDEDAPQGSYVYGMLVGRDLPDINVPDSLLPFNLDTAKMYVEKSAYLGFGKAQLKMGQAYELCQLGCEFNPSYSLHYYGLAAKQGLPEAALGVSRWFLFGYEGVFKKNEELAFKYAQEAAASKLPTGEFAMGYYYEIGIHVNQSIPDARKWYQLAADHGNKDAIGRLESLNHDKSLSKRDHETTTLTRIKSQHGSQRGKRPDRFKQSQQMPTLSETAPLSPADNQPHFPQPTCAKSTASPRVSPQPSPGIQPTIVAEHANFPDPSRASVVGIDRPQAFGIRLDGNASRPMRPHSAAPYPDDDRPAPLNLSRPHSTAPYPVDDVPASPRRRYGPGLQPAHGPQADRPSSAFGIKTQSAGPRPIPLSNSTGSLQPPTQSGPPHGRAVSAGWESQGHPGAYRRPSPGPGLSGQRPHIGDDMYGRPDGAHPTTGVHMAGNKLQKQSAQQPHSSVSPTSADFGREYGPRTSSRPASEMPPQHDFRGNSQGYERFSRVPGATGRPERLSSLPPQDTYQPPPRVSTGFGQATPSQHRPTPASTKSASVPPNFAGNRPSEPNHPSGPGIQTATAGPAKPAKGPATFEDMGIPQGKQDGDCISGSPHLYASPEISSLVLTLPQQESEQTPLLGNESQSHENGSSGGRSDSRRASTWSRIREIGIFVWALVATAAAIILAITIQHNQETSAPSPQPAKRNLVFMVSDGMGPASLEMTREYRRYVKHLPEHDSLNLDKHFWGSSRTRSSNSLVTDSAAGATAFSCGKKSYNGAISMLPDFQPCGSVLEAAKRAGYATGLVVTTDITDATPACFASHVVARQMQDSIALQEVGHGPLGRSLDLMLGGGRCRFMPNSTAGSCRLDDTDVIALAQEKYGWSYADSRKAFDAFRAGKNVTLPLLGLFASSDFPFELDRRNMNDVYPSLSEMVRVALRSLERATAKSEKGFFLMIEGSRIDHAGHINDPAAQVHEVLEYDNTFKVVLDFINDTATETTLVATSDHETGGLSTALQEPGHLPVYNWYPQVLANASASCESLAASLQRHVADKSVYTSKKQLKSWINDELMINGLGITDATDDELSLLADDPPASVVTFAAIISLRAHIGWSTHGHTAVDVNVYSSGSPETEKIRGNIENTDIGNFLSRYLEVDVDEITKELRDKTHVSNDSSFHVTQDPKRTGYWASDKYHAIGY